MHVISLGLRGKRRARKYEPSYIKSAYPLCAQGREDRSPYTSPGLLPPMSCFPPSYPQIFQQLWITQISYPHSFLTEDFKETSRSIHGCGWKLEVSCEIFHADGGFRASVCKTMTGVHGTESVQILGKNIKIVECSSLELYEWVPPRRIIRSRFHGRFQEYFSQTADPCAAREEFTIPP